MKPIVVRHTDFWRFYRGDRDLLKVISLGDLLTGNDAEWCDDPVADHLYSRLEAPADVIAIAPPTEGEWAQLPGLLSDG